jgi:Zn-dependent protease with chaperone function
MDFFEAQEHARKRTTRLVVLFGLAVLGTIALSYLAAMALLNGYHAQHHRSYYLHEEGSSWFDPVVLAAVAAGTLTVVGFASLYKWSQFRSGGATVAEGVGGRRLDPNTTDLHERRLLNVVEEMAIASGVPVPTVYVLDSEAGLNAFAAGLTPSDAVVAVTRGTMEKLSRDELQGVVAHEFSHILNGDMRLNVKLAAIVFGILVIGLLGRGILRGFGRGGVRVRGKGGGGVAAILAIGLAMLIIGYIGYFFGRLIQAAVSRQREFLADASAVQFTRNPGGVTGALRKIGGYAIGSHLATDDAGEIGHFLFAEGFDHLLFAGLFATHPPLDTRIRAVDPQWDGKYFDPATIVDVRNESFQRLGYGSPPLQADVALRRAYNTPTDTPPLLPTRALAFAPAAVMAQIGSLTHQQVDHARDLIDATPAQLRDAARNPEEAPALIYALLTEPHQNVGDGQAAIIASHAGDDTLRRVRALLPPLAGLAADTRLVLAQLTVPVLRQLPAATASVLSTTCQGLIECDQRLSYFEYALQKMVLRTLTVADAPAAATAQIYSFNAVVGEIAVVLSALAWAGALQGKEQADGSETADTPAADAAFRDGAGELKLIEDRLSLLDPAVCEFSQLDAALDKLAGASLPIKQRLLLACAHTVLHDGVVRDEEAELLRAFAAVLACPMPPLIAGS